MGIVVVLISGAVLGWIASIITGRENAREVVLQVILGAAGSLATALTFPILFDVANAQAGHADPMVLLIGAIGAVLVLGIVNLFGKSPRIRS